MDNHITTLSKLWDDQYGQKNIDSPFLFTGPTRDAKSFSRKEVNATSHCLAAYFMSQGLEKGDRVLLFAINGPVYMFYELAIQIAGLVNVTVDHYTTPERLQQIYEEVEPRAILVPNYEEYKAHKEWLDQMAQNCQILCDNQQYEEMDEQDKVTLLSYAVDFGKVYWREHLQDLKQRKDSVRGQDISSIVYDTRKDSPHEHGIVITHNNILQAIRGILGLFPDLSKNERILSILSNAYLLQRLYAFYLPIATGLDLHYSTGPSHLFREIQTGKPKAVVLVPDLLRLIRKEAYKNFRKGRFIKRRYYKSAFSVAHRVLKLRHEGKKVPFGLKLKFLLAKRQIIRPIRKKYFRNISLLVCDRQGLSEELEYYCHALRLPLVTGFGLNETSGLIAVNLTPNKNPISAGKVVPGLTVKTDPDGNFLVKEPLVMHGYWKDKPIGDQWLKTYAKGRIEGDWVYLD